MTFYVTGGTLQSDAPSYVERDADRQLFEGLLQGEFCYVLTARQMGKSSLMVRTANRLRAAGVEVVALDLTALGGQNVTPHQWYFGLLDTLGQELDLGDELEAFWESHEHLGPLHRFMKSIRQIVLPRLQTLSKTGAVATRTIRPRPEATSPEAAPLARFDDQSGARFRPRVRLVIFVDEIDFVRSLPFSTDEFFAAIRECYNHRTLDPTCDQVTFCLLGVASPSDLIRDTRTTPFNIGRRIELNDFTPAEAASLIQGLEEAKPNIRDPKLFLDRILYWTEGHPYLTQRLCRATAEALRGTTTETRRASTDEPPRALVDRMCADLFFTSRARERDDNLIFVRERLLRNETDRASLLDLYRKVWQGKRVMDDEADSLISLLRLSGVVRVSQGRLRERNRIYYRVFNLEWVRSNLPEAELRRQREAYRRGVIWAASVSAVVVLSLAVLSLLAVKKTSEAYLAQAKEAKASSYSGYGGRMGQRVKALAAIRQARRWGLFFHDALELRNEAIAALNLVDLEEHAGILGSDGDLTAPELNSTFTRHAVARQDGRILILDRARAGAEFELAPIGPPARWVRFSSTDEYLGVGYGSENSGEPRFALWRLADRSRICELEEEVDRDAWDISPNGDRLAVGLSQQDIRFCSLPDGQWLPTPGPEPVQMEARQVSCLRFDPSGKRLAHGSQAGLNVYVRNIAENSTESYHHSSGVIQLAWRPGGHELVTACENGEIYLLDIGSRRKDRLYRSPANLVGMGVCFNRLGTVLATVCSDSSLRLWRPQDRRQILSLFDLDEARPATVRFSADDGWLSLTTSSNRVRLFKVEGGRELITVVGEPGNAEAFQSIGFDPQGRVLIGAGPHPGIWLWNTRDWRSFGHTNLTGFISAVAFDPQGDMLLASTTAGFFRLPVRSVRHSNQVELHIEPAQRLVHKAGQRRFALSTNGTTAVVHATTNAADHVDVFPVRDPDQSSRWVADCKLDAIAITPDGRWMFACSTAEREILVWDLFGSHGRTPCRRFTGSKPMCLSPSGNWLVTGDSGQIRFRQVGSWRDCELTIPRSHRFERFTPVAFAALPTPGECLLAVAASPTTIELFRFWDKDPPRIKKLARLESPDRLPVASLAFEPGGGRLAAGSEAQIVQVWDLNRLRAELDQCGLAAGFPEFRAESSVTLSFVIEPTNHSGDEKAAAHLQEEWLERVADLSEEIEAAELNGDPGLFEALLRRSRLYQGLGWYEKALRDLNEVLQLHPNHETAPRMKSVVERELQSQRPASGPAGSSR
jgi:WD40 repeat protein